MGNQDTFNPVSYGQACSKGGCHTVTYGYLSKSGADVTWGSEVTLGQPFPVHEPVWAWGAGRDLVSGYGSAIALIIVGLFFNGITFLLLFALVMIVRHTRLRRSQQMPYAQSAVR